MLETCSIKSCEGWEAAKARDHQLSKLKDFIYEYFLRNSTDLVLSCIFYRFASFQSIFGRNRELNFIILCRFKIGTVSLVILFLWFRVRQNFVFWKFLKRLGVFTCECGQLLSHHFLREILYGASSIHLIGFRLVPLKKSIILDKLSSLLIIPSKFYPFSR